MEFWGVEVKAGESVKCEPGEEKYLHLSQAALGESKDKGTEIVRIFVKFNDQKLVLGTLSADKCAQISYDLVFEKEFELSHNSKHASVHFIGYKTITQEPYSSGEDDDFPGTESESEEELQIVQNANGKPKVKDEQGKPGAGKAIASKDDNSAAKAKAKKVEPVKAEKPKDDNEDAEDEDDSEDDDDSEDESDDEEMNDAVSDDSDDEDEDESSDEDDEATPQKAASGKKRPTESASKTPVPEKKAKVVSPAGGQKTGGEKKGHAATPHPAKQAGKTSANNDKAKQQTPKSAGSVTCKSCSKTFNSDNALQAHSKAKHGGAK